MVADDSDNSEMQNWKRTNAGYVSVSDVFPTSA
jgi:hypothetical protein